MDRTRVIFFGFIAASLVSVGTLAYMRSGASAPGEPVAQQPAATKPASTVAPIKATSVPATQAPAGSTAAPTAAAGEAAKPVEQANFAPIFGKSVNPELPKYVCGAYSLGSYHTLLQIQQAGLDLKYDFNLGIVPFYLNDAYSNNEADRAKMLQEGKLDCLLTTADAVTALDHGAITAIIDESAGADQIWARNINTINDLKGKRIVFEADSPSEYMAHYMLHKAGIEHDDVTMIGKTSIGEAIAAFNAEEADAVVGWDPYIFDAERSGGTLLVSTREFRPIIDVIVTNRDAIEKRSRTVEYFHEAWFEAVQAQARDFDGAAKLVATWGNNTWSGVSLESAAEDWRSQLSSIAMANLAHNKAVFSDPTEFLTRMEDARELIKEGGEASVSSRPIASLINGNFVKRVAEKFEAQKLDINPKMVNDTLSLVQLNSTVAESTTSGSTAEVVTSGQPDTAMMSEVATLPCSRFEFIPNTTRLLPESQRLLNECAIKTMLESQSLYMRITASSAWPGPKGAFSQKQVEDIAKARAEAIAAYMTERGIAKERFVVEWVIPPAERRETNDLQLQAQDRYVELALLVSGF
jgi:ABC-type nitrate/sulfonate/bicarbonate transport system substrate-binding protein